MAEIQLAVNRGTGAGVEPTVQTGVTAAATDQYFMPNGGNTILRVSGGAAAANMTIITGATVGGLAVEDPVIAIPAGETRLFRFNPAVYNAGGQVQVTFAAADATLELEAIGI